MPEAKQHEARLHPPVPNLPRSGPGISAVDRAHFGGAFESGGARYDTVRPGYPAAVVDFMVPPGARDAVDVGAGTGIFTALLAGRGLSTTAVDPSADMLAELAAKLPAVRAVAGTAEATGLAAGAYDVVSVAQAWHWCDPLAASTEAARILRPGGTLALVWNQLDVTVPWVHRLSRIMHAGDVHRPGFVPVIGPEFSWSDSPKPESMGPGSFQLHWDDEVTPELLLELVKTRSYYLRANESTRAKVAGNLSWYLYEHLGHAAGEPLALPYYTHAWRAVARPARDAGRASREASGSGSV